VFIGRTVRLQNVSVWSTDPWRADVATATAVASLFLLFYCEQTPYIS
jgi:hypothetical protein